MAQGKGRKTELTPELQQRFIAALTAGNYIEAACGYVGIAKQTFYEWMQRGEGTHKTRPQNKLYADFADAVNKALSIPEVAAVAVWRKATEDDWRAAAEFLARRYPDRWGRTRQEITGKDGEPFKVYLNVDVEKV